jgi:hypothetical protein
MSYQRLTSFIKKTTFLRTDKDHTLTYQRLTSFIVSFTYLGFLNTRLSLDPRLSGLLSTSLWVT